MEKLEFIARHLSKAAMKIGFTGSRAGITPEQESALLRILASIAPKTIEAHHGMCVGADQQINDILRKYYPPSPLCIVGHPPIDKKYYAAIEVDVMWGDKDYLDRNRDIVQETEMLIACPNSPERSRSGTWATVRYARKMNMPIRIIWPDGRIEVC